MQLESIFLNIYQRHMHEPGVDEIIPLELDLRFNIILFGIVRLDQVKSGIETMLRMSHEQ